MIRAPARTEIESLPGRVRAAVEEWAPGRPWLPRLLLLLWCAWTGLRFARDRDAGSILDALTLGIHEGGHLIFSPLGKFLHVAGGTIAQLAAPTAAMVVLLRQRDWFGPAFCGVWLATSLYGVAVYMADARAQELPLVTVGGGDVDDPDWTYLLDTVGLLEHDLGLARLVSAVAFLVMWSSIAWGGYVVWTIRAASASPPVLAGPPPRTLSPGTRPPRAPPPRIPPPATPPSGAP